MQKGNVGKACLLKGLSMWVLVLRYKAGASMSWQKRFCTPSGENYACTAPGYPRVSDRSTGIELIQNSGGGTFMQAPKLPADKRPTLYLV